MTPDGILELRQRNHGLLAAAFRKPEEVVSWLGAVQAQDYLGALWALGLRTRAALVKLLPPFDEFTVAYQDRSLLVAGRNPGYSVLGPVIVIDGRVAGEWRRTLSSGKSAGVAVTTRLRRRLTPAERKALAEAIGEYARFLGRKPA